MSESLLYLLICAVVAFVLLLLSCFKARGLWVCDCGHRFHSSEELDRHINECEGLR